MSEPYIFQSDFVKITSCNFIDIARWVGYGIWAGDSKNLTIDNSVVRGSYGYGIFAKHSPGLRINNSEFSGDYMGLGALIEMSDNIVTTNSRFHDNFGGGIEVQDSKNCIHFYIILSLSYGGFNHIQFPE